MYSHYQIQHSSTVFQRLSSLELTVPKMPFHRDDAHCSCRAFTTQWLPAHLSDNVLLILLWIDLGRIGFLIMKCGICVCDVTKCIGDVFNIICRLTTRKLCNLQYHRSMRVSVHVNLVDVTAINSCRIECQVMISSWQQDCSCLQITDNAHFTYHLAYRRHVWHWSDRLTSHLLYSV